MQIIKMTSRRQITQFFYSVYIGERKSEHGHWLRFVDKRPPKEFDRKYAHFIIFLIFDNLV